MIQMVGHRISFPNLRCANGDIPHQEYTLVSSRGSLEAVPILPAHGARRLEAGDGIEGGLLKLQMRVA